MYRRVNNDWIAIAVIARLMWTYVSHVNVVENHCVSGLRGEELEIVFDFIDDQSSS